MSGSQSLQPDPSAIGRLSKAPFALLPDAPRLFRRRSERFEALAEGSHLSPYLHFLARLTAAQADIAAELPVPVPIASEQVERARANQMPPLDRNVMIAAPGPQDVVDRFLTAIEPAEKPRQAADALRGLREATRETREAMLRNVAADSIPFESLPQHVYLSAAVQIYAAKLAGTLDASRLVPIGTGLCPVCGGPPVSSMVVGHQGAEGARYAACAFCGTSWNEVRIKCLACGTTKGIGYKAAETEGEEATVKAETCDECRSWVKILYQNKNPSLEAVADDVASLGLDLLMQETEYRRAGFDPFLLGY
ncbi:formate dehydrogenase accessory protein FdhE [Roseomonas xinghualingensis]|uniref:formate dehydrogenase accessory protein FdhE n=1 Tax=Roseomonas xinghualingensis TaxID=2986475 RepID=UPI0021F0C8A0|nr:formate dehydrogenase accessory protein FdhE [Roseomonas sp. SXEYE001]MCV4209434.1 formate dehydrogenase accessory protein FdhE [Roseomonas sp. SXEYE001]